VRSPLLVLFCLFAGSLFAQEDVGKLLQTRNVQMAGQFQNKTFTDGKAFKAGNARVKDFQYVQKFNSKKFEAKGYQTRSFWGGDFKFATTAANTKGVYKTNEYQTKPVEVKNAYEHSRTAETRNYVTNEFRGHEVWPRVPKKAQTEADKKGTLSIDQVREILNKNK
jgi:hypothetical protein